MNAEKRLRRMVAATAASEAEVSLRFQPDDDGRRSYDWWQVTLAWWSRRQDRQEQVVGSGDSLGAALTEAEREVRGALLRGRPGRTGSGGRP